MHVTVSRTFPASLHDVIERLVRMGFAGVESGDVEVHVKARSRVRRTYVALYRHPGETRPERTRFRRRKDAVASAARFGGGVEAHSAAHPRAHGWSGRTYQGVPGMARVGPGTAYLVTANIPADPRRLRRYPTTHRDPRLKTGPVVTFGCWHDQLLHLCAHEARHVHQFRHRLSASELDAERWAAVTLGHHGSCPWAEPEGCRDDAPW